VLSRAAETRGCRGVGYEVHEERAAAASAAIAAAGLSDRVCIVAGNALESSLPPDVTAIYLYLIDHGLKAVWPMVAAAAAADPHKPIRLVTVLYPLPADIGGSGAVVLERRGKGVATKIGPSGVELRTPIYSYHVTARGAPIAPGCETPVGTAAAGAGGLP